MNFHSFLKLSPWDQFQDLLNSFHPPTLQQWFFLYCLSIWSFFNIHRPPTASMTHLSCVCFFVNFYHTVRTQPGNRVHQSDVLCSAPSWAINPPNHGWGSDIRWRGQGHMTVNWSNTYACGRQHTHTCGDHDIMVECLFIYVLSVPLFISIYIEYFILFSPSLLASQSPCHLR